jgi:hypothetical protein
MLTAAAETLISTAAVRELLSTENCSIHATGHVRVLTVDGVDIIVCLCVSCLQTSEVLPPTGAAVKP